MNVFDPELGRKIRAVVTLALVVLTAVLGLLQGVLDVLGALPDWQLVGSLSLFLRGVVTFLTSYTPVGNTTDKR